MKIFKNEIMKKLIRIVIYIIAIVIIRLLPVTNQDSAMRFLKIVEFTLGILVMWTIISIFKIYTTPLFKSVNKFLSEALKQMFKPIRNKIKKIYNRKQKFVKGSDESKFILNFNIGIIDKLKNKLRFREKLNFNNSLSNIEKIRLLYIKLILILMENNYEIKYSYTPKEIKEKLNYKDNAIIFDVYEQVRYGNKSNIAVSDNIVKLCENITDCKL